MVQYSNSHNRGQDDDFDTHYDQNMVPINDFGSHYDQYWDKDDDQDHPINEFGTHYDESYGHDDDNSSNHVRAFDSDTVQQYDILSGIKAIQ